MKLKAYQQAALDALRRYLVALRMARAQYAASAAAGVWVREAWQRSGRDPETYHERRNGVGAPTPVVCLQMPTGAGKTLLAVKAIDAIQKIYREQTGLVLWITPTTQIYRQTLQALRDRAHPYRQLLDLGSAGRTLILEKDALFTPADIRDHLAVLLLMLPSANRRRKATLRIFRDQGGFDAFFPPEDRWREHAELLARIPNLDAFDAPTFTGQRIVKTSLGNVLRMLNPLIILDEGHRAYSPTAQATLLGFNPAFMLELSATPPPQSNILARIDAQTVLREGMIKLDIHLHSTSGGDWRDALLAAHLRRVALERIAEEHRRNNGAYIRPLCLIQVERTGAQQQRPGMVHALDARDFLIAKCGVSPDQVAIKSSERDDIESHNLLDLACPIRYIITRQALQEGWDCPFAYVLAVLTNAEATTGLAQLVGRVLRQPYARKTGLPALDESYVYCCRHASHQALQAIRAGLADEGLGEVAGEVIHTHTVAPNGRDGAHQTEARHTSACNTARPHFVVADGNGGWRAIKYEIDVLSRIDWEQVDRECLATIDLDADVQSGKTGPFAESGSISDADLVLIARQLADIMPSPWAAYDFARDALTRLRRRYADTVIRRDLGFVIEALKQRLAGERDRLMLRAIGALIEQGALVGAEGAPATAAEVMEYLQ